MQCSRYERRALICVMGSSSGSLQRRLRCGTAMASKQAAQIVLKKLTAAQHDTAKVMHKHSAGVGIRSNALTN